jgi:DNA-binding response OmpR family regulator
MTLSLPLSITAVTEAHKHTPDLIILDLGLPGGDGFVVIQRLKALHALHMIPIIVVSARDFHSTLTRVLDVGAKAFVQTHGQFRIHGGYPTGPGGTRAPEQVCGL